MKHTLAALLVVATSYTAVAQDIPPVDDLRARAAQLIPGYWTIEAFRIVASASQGDPISPRALIRFEADAAPQADLFTATGETVGPFTVVLKTHAKEARRVLHGTMQLSYRAGVWDGPVTIENPVDRLGQPADFFNGPTIELGSERQREVLAAIRSNSIAEARAAMEAELRRMTAEHAERVDRLRTENAQSIRRIEQQHSERLAALTAENQKSLADLEAAYQQKLSELQERYNPTIGSAEKRLEEETARFAAQLAAQRDDQRTAHERELAALRDAHALGLTRLREGNARELATLREAHARAVGELRARQARELAEAETGFAVLRQNLDAQIAAAEDVIAKQEALIGKRETIADNRTWIERMAADRVAQRRTNLEALFGEWKGTATCGSGTLAVTFTADARFGTGVSGKMHSSRTSAPDNALLQHETGDIVLPAKLVLVLQGWYSLGQQTVIELELDETGLLVGQSRDGACSMVRLSR